MSNGCSCVTVHMSTGASKAVCKNVFFSIVPESCLLAEASVINEMLHWTLNSCQFVVNIAIYISTGVNFVFVETPDQVYKRQQSGETLWLRVWHQHSWRLSLSRSRPITGHSPIHRTLGVKGTCLCYSLALFKQLYDRLDSLTVHSIHTNLKKLTFDYMMLLITIKFTVN